MKFGKYTKAKWIYNTEELGSCHSCDSMVVGFITTYAINIVSSNPTQAGVLDTTLYDKVGQWLVTGLWFSPVSSTNKTNRHDITEILLKAALNTMTLPYPEEFNYNIDL